MFFLVLLKAGKYVHIRVIFCFVYSKTFIWWRISVGEAWFRATKIRNMLPNTGCEIWKQKQFYSNSKKNGGVSFASCNSQMVTHSNDLYNNASQPVFFLTLNVPIPDKEIGSEKIKLNFYFHTSLWCLNFEAPQRSVKIKIKLNFYFNTTFRNERVFKG